MEQTQTMENVLSLGTWLGRKQALGMIAGRCTAAEMECLIEVYDNKLYLAVDPTWEDYCKRLGISRRTAERLIRRFKQQGPSLARLNCFTRIKPSEYHLFAAALSDEGLVYNGETIPIEPENTFRLAQAVEAIRQDAAPEVEQPDPAARAFARAEKGLQSVLAEFSRLHAMKLDMAGNSKLAAVVEAARDQLDLIRTSLSS